MAPPPPNTAALPHTTSSFVDVTEYISSVHGQDKKSTPCITPNWEQYAAANTNTFSAVEAGIF